MRLVVDLTEQEIEEVLKGLDRTISKMWNQGVSDKNLKEHAASTAGLKIRGVLSLKNGELG